MGCLQQNSNFDKGKIIKMPNTKDNDYIDNQLKELKVIVTQLQHNLTEEKNKKAKKEKIQFSIEIAIFVLTMLATFAGVFIYLEGKFDDCLTEKDIETLNTTVDKLNLWGEGDINDKSKIGAGIRIDNLETDIDEIKDGIGEIREAINISAININNSIVASNLVYTTSMENETSAKPVSFSLTTYLGSDPDGNEYNIEDVVGKKVLLTYNEDDKEVYFWGELNEKLQWHGHCVTNSYNKDGTLYGICESEFKDGKRLNYESFYLTKIKNEWIYTNRTCDENGNLGISEKFNFQYNEPKNFTNTNASVYDLIYIKDFSNSNDMTLLTYYSGYTLNGTYNDQYDYEKEQGKRTPPFEIIFDSDGYIEILYIGQFVDGEFHDQTGKAKEFVFDTSNNINKYFCYEGTFADGKRDGEVSSKDYLTVTEIEQKKIAGIEFGIELNWHEADDDNDYDKSL